MKTEARGKALDAVSATVNARSEVAEAAGVHGHFTVQAHRDGKLLWEEELANLIVNAGLTYLNGVALTSVAQITAWYLLLVQDATTPATVLPTIAAADTMASHAAWAEVTAYNEAARQACTLVAGAAGVSTNSASKAVFTISTTTTYVGGVALASVSTKSATTGTMFSGKAFAAVRALQAGDTLTITYTVTNTSS